MKKMICIILSLLLMAVAVGCAAKADDALVSGTGTPEDQVQSVSVSTVGTAEITAPPVSVPAPDVTTEPVGDKDVTTEPHTAATTTVRRTTTVAATMTAAAFPEASKALAEAEVAVDGVKTPSMTMPAPIVPGEPDKPEVQVGAGMLTAGEWKDLDDIPFWTELLNNNDWYKLMEQRGLFASKIVPVKLVDGNGNPCFIVPVILKDAEGKEIYRAVSDVNGMAYLLYDLDNQKQEAGCVSVGGKEYEIAKEGETKITVDAAAVEVKQLDLLFMIDTTGSMGDELRYLQAELRDVIRRVAESGGAYAINLSVNFYRDNGDEYVVRSFAFTGDIDKAIAQINEQQSSGGGDYAEAVHLALEDVVNNHQWREDAVKLCFMVLDAPPHKEHEIAGIDERMQKTVLSMAETGIRFIPLASSGVDTETEFLLRSWAVMTGGTYTFLTNHSGIGNSHLEPTIGEYEVEKLNDLLVRVISEYCGK